MRFHTVTRTFILLLGTVSFCLQFMTVAAKNAPQTVAKSTAAQKYESVRAAMLELEKARAAYAEGRYTDAEFYYRASLASLPVVPATKKQFNFIKLSLADALLAKAMDYRKVGRRDEAIEFLLEAFTLAPENNYISKQLAITRDSAHTNPAISPQHIANVGEVERLLTLAYGQYELGNFDSALESFRGVSAIDPYNNAAQLGIQNVLSKINPAHRAAYRVARALALETNDAEWQNYRSKTTDIVMETDVSTESLSALVDEGENLAAALEDIHITKLNFEDSNIEDIVAIIRAYLKQAVAEGKIAANQSNVSANFGNSQSDSFNAASKLRLNQSYQEISLKDLLDGIKMQLGIQYYILPTGIEISYSGRDFGPMSERHFVVHPDFFKENVTSNKEDDFLESAPKPGLNIKRVDPMVHLKSMGVSFPKGAYAQYSLHTRTLIVRNTLHNIEEIAGLIDYSPKNGKKQVLVNIYIMTVSTDTLKDLGFEWLLDIQLGSHNYLGGGSEIPGVPQFEGGLGPNKTHSMSAGLRSGSEVLSTNSIERLIQSGSASGLQNTGPQKSPGILSFRGVWNAIDLTILMRGLDQKKDFDLIQNPQLVFTPGREEQVSVYNVREMFYPVEYDAPQFTTSRMFIPGTWADDLDDFFNGDFFGNRISTAVIASASHPTEFAYFGMRDEEVAGIGTILQIHSAEIDSTGQFVDLALTTTVNEFDGFINWGSPILSALTTDEEIKHVLLTDNPILQPIFKRQMINTQVSVASGSVIVLGGLQESKKISYVDKIPIMGDIPFVGRLFRSEGSKTENRVLLFFAKVNIVDPTGSDLKTGKNPSDN